MGSTSYSEKIRVELIKLLYQQLGVALSAESFAAICLFFALRGDVNQTLLIAWLIFNLFFSGCLRHLSIFLFKRSPLFLKNDPTHITYWFTIFLIGVIFSGISWGALSSILMVKNDLVRQSFEIFLIVGVAAAANPTYSPSRLCYITFLILTIFPLAIFFFTAADIYILLGLLCFAYIGIMLNTSLYSYHLLHTSLELRFENIELINGLKAREVELFHQATHDPLTKLPNRILLIEKLKLDTLEADKNNTLIAILFLDIDGFKYINDSSGHAIGDKLLICISQRLKKIIKPNDFIARETSDEFIVLLTGLKNEIESHAIAKKYLHALQNEFIIDNDKLNITASIGISFYPKDAKDPDTLIRNADIAMYEAKELGRNNFQCFNRELKNKILNRSILENKLRASLDRKELFLMYQPIASLKTGNITGVEALIRWQEPDLGLLSPHSFIPIAEESNLIIKISEWVLREACLQGKTWLDNGVHSLQLSINLSGKQFKQPNFLEQVCRILEETKFNPHHLSFELTESILMDDIENSINILHEMKKLGITILIDDFGVGYSSLNYLKRLPVDKLKIDRSFIEDIPNHADDVAIVSAIIALGTTLNLKLVAEGVETKEHLHFLIEHHCHEIQGFYLAKPLGVEECTKMLLDKNINVLK